MKLRFVAALGVAAVALSVAVTGGATALSRPANMTALTPSGPGGTWGPVIPLQDDHGYPMREAVGATMSCASAGNCADLVWGTGAPAVVEEVNGAWGKPEYLPGFAAAAPGFESGGRLAISCTAPGDCAVGGSYARSDGTDRSFVAAEADGSWGNTRTIPGLATLAGNSSSELESLSCGSPGNCAAVGGVWSTAGLGVPFVASEVNGVWGSAQVPRYGALDTRLAANLTVVSCASAGNCSAGGNAGVAGSAAWDVVVIDEASGAWGPLTSLPGSGTAARFSGTVRAISCGAPGDCAVGGQETSGSSRLPFLAHESGGTWGTATTDPGLAAVAVTAGTVYSVSCTGADACAAGGGITVAVPGSTQKFPLPFAVSESSGTWGAADTFPSLALPGGSEYGVIYAVSCASPSNCTAAGSYTAPDKERVFTAAQTGGVWGTAGALPGTAPAGNQLASDIACPATGYCSVSGSVGLTSFVSDEATASAVTLSASASRAVYGAEQAVRLTARVTSTAPGTPTGTVTVTRAGKPVCTITLSGGTGGCTLAKTALPVGASTLSAAYSGDVTFVNSVSAAVSVTVAKAATRTAFALSKTTIAVGHEATERFTVTVSPRYSGIPSGRVLIKLGERTVAAMTLKNGKGSYTLSARQFKPGTYRLVAVYAGDSDFVSSASQARTLTVVK